MTLIEQQKRQGDLVTLKGKDDYAVYHRHMRLACALLAKYAQLLGRGKHEEEQVRQFLNKLITTLELFRLKYLYDPSHDLWLDLNESGYPHMLSMMDLEADLQLKNDKLGLLSSAGDLKKQILDALLTSASDEEEPKDLLAQLAQREYLERLDDSAMFLPFTTGALTLVETRSTLRTYLFSWACYDPTSNMPFFHLMAFDQDTDDEPMEQYGQSYVQLLKTIRYESTAVLPLESLATTLDTKIGPIHPKVLSRVRLGPILCPLHSREQKPEPLIGLLKEYGNPDDFAIIVKNELVYSKRQEPQKLGFLGYGATKAVREIYATADRGHNASSDWKTLFIPHHVLQRIVTDPRFESYNTMKRIAYTKDGEIYVV